MKSSKKETIIMAGSIIIILLILVAVLVVSKKIDSNKNPNVDLLNINYEIEGNNMNLEQYKTENPIVAMNIEGYGSVVFELYPDVAPNTVNNFISLVKSGFYDNNTFHRLSPGFVLQGGDPTGQGNGGPGYKIDGEFAVNGFNNNLKHEIGVISMARSQAYDSAGSQFFIMLGNHSSLDGQYAAFGKVIDGWDNIQRIESQEKTSSTQAEKLIKNLKIVKAVVDLKGKTYPPVKKVTN